MITKSAPSIKAVRVPLSLLVAATQLLASCMTTGTGKLVRTTPMTEDLEAKVLRQTSVSGAVIGTVAGAGLGIGVAALRIALLERQMGRQLTDKERSAVIAQTVVPMATAGGIFGYKKGQQKGKQVAATAKERDQLAQLVKGAHTYNNHLAEYNDALRKEAANARSAKDPKKIKTLRKEATHELKLAETRLTQRERSMESIDPSYRNQYQKTLPALKREKDELELAIRDLAATETTIHL